MFNGEESIRIRSNLSEDRLEEIIENALDRIGRVRFDRRGRFEIRSRRFETSFATTEITGRLVEGRKEGVWRLVVKFVVRPTPLCWVIVVIGALFSFLGVLILLAPHSTKGEVERVVRGAVRDARDDVEDEESRAASSG